MIGLSLIGPLTYQRNNELNDRGRQHWLVERSRAAHGSMRSIAGACAVSDVVAFSWAARMSIPTSVYLHVTHESDEKLLVTLDRSMTKL